MAYTINRHLANLLTNTGVLDTGKIPADYITNAHIADNTIASSQLHSSFTIGSAHIPANTVTISHLAVTDGTAGQVLKTDGSGNLSFTTISADKIEEGNTFVETIDTGSNGQILFVTENTQRWQISSAGHLIPIAHNSFDIGSASHKVRDLYVDDNSIHIGSNTKLSINSDGDFQVTDENNVPKKLKVDEIEIGTGDDRVIIKKSASGDLEQQRKISGVKQTATKPFLIGVHNSGDITEGGSNKFYTDARVQAYLTGQGIVNQSAVIAAITDSAPATLDTLNELAAAIGDDANFSTTVTNSIATKLPLTGGTLTGALTVSAAGSSLKGPVYIASQNSTGEGGEITLNGSNGNTSHTLDTVNGTFRIFDSSGTFITGNSGYGLNAINGYRVNGTQVIDNNRNLKNIVTISSGAITSSASITAAGNSNNFGNTTISNLSATTVTASGSITASGNSNSFGNTTLGTISSGGITATGDTVITGSSGSGNAFVVQRGDNSAHVLRIHNSGEVVVPNNYLFAASSGTSFYSQGDAVFRTAIRNDTTGMPLLVSDDLNITGSTSINGTQILSSTRALTNVTGNISMFTNDSGYTSFDGDYNSLSNRPTIPTNNNQLTNGAGYITSSALSPYLTSSTAASTYATASDITTQIANLVDSAPGTLNTLNELAAALGDDANFSTTITNSIATKAPLASPNFTGTPTVGGNTVLTSNAGLNANNINAGTVNQARLPTNLGSLRDLSGVNAIFRFQETDVTNNPQWWLVADGGNFSIRLNNSGVYPFQITSNSNNNAVSSIYLGYDTEVNGNISAITGNTTGKFAVKSTAVHGSYDFYNNGTSYFNGSVIVDDALDITGSNRALKIAGTTRINSVGDFIGTSYYVGGTNVIDTSGNWVGPAVNAGTLDNLDSTKFTYYRGVVSGDWDTIFTTASNQTQTSGLYQINNTASGHSNFPVASGAMLAPYSYGGVFAWNLANHTFKLYSTHVGNLYYQSGWNNDEYSGWRMIIDSGNYAAAGLWASHNDGSGSGLDADLLDGLHSSSFIRSDANDTVSGALTLTNSGNDFKGHLFFSEHSTGRHYIHFKTNHSTNQIDWRIQTGGVNSVIHSWTNTNAYFATQVQTATQGILWGASNDGSGSGLDADLLDGLNSGDFLRHYPNIGSTDMNNIGPGLYGNSSNSSNQPFDNNAGYVIHGQGLDTRYKGQIFQYSTDGSLYIRGNHNSSWSSWAKVATESFVTSQGYSTGGVSLSANNVFTATQYFRKNNVTNYTDAQLLTESYGGASSTAGIGFHISGSVGRYLYMNNAGNLYWNDSSSKIWNASNDGSGSGLDADTVDGIQGASFLRSDAADTFGSQLTSANNVPIRFVAANATDDNDGKIAAGLFGTGLNIVGAQTSAGTGRQVRIWGDVITDGGHKYWNANNDGSGSGLDADLLDGQHASAFLGVSAKAADSNLLDGIDSTSFARSDASDTLSGDYAFTGGHGAINITSSSIVSNASSTWTGNPGAQGKIQYHSNRWYIVADSSSNRIVQFRRNGTDVSYIDNSGNFVGSITGNAGTVGGVSAGSLIRSDTADSFSGQLTMATQKALIASNYGHGVYGIYASTRHQHVWSMGTAYNLAADGQSTGNLYGLSYTHTNVGTSGGASIAGLGHQLHGRANGGLQWALGDGAYFTGSVQRSGNTIWDAGNDGSGSGLDADLLDGLNVHNTQSTQNSANTILRTQVNGYSMLGWINTTSGDAGGAVPSRFYCNDGGSDAYIRYVDIASKRSLMNVTAKGGYNGREQNTSDTNYWVGSMGWGATDLNQIMNYGSGFWDSWSNPANKPTGTSHWTGMTFTHYSASTTYHHGGQLAMGAGNPGNTYLRGWWANGGSGYAWQRIWTDGNDGSGSGLDADLLDGYNSAEAGNSIILRTASNGYIQTQNWRNVGNAGAYSTTANGYHWYPNTGFTYGTARLNGIRGGYSGIVMDGGGDVVTGMFDGSGNGGDYNTSSGWHYYYHRGNDCLGINDSNTSSSYGAYVTGALYATGDIVGSSDIRLKKNINTIEDGLAKVEKLRGVTYEWKDSKESGSDGNNITPERMGVIAQEIMDIVPEVVTHDKENDRYGVDYGHLTGLLIEAVKELSDKVKQLEKKLEEK